MKRIGICVLALIFTVGLCVPTFATVNQSSANLNVGLKEGKVHNRINSEKNIIDYEQGNSQSVKAKLEAQVKGILEDNNKERFIDSDLFLNGALVGADILPEIGRAHV